jgi:hypothetical protein
MALLRRIQEHPGRWAIAAFLTVMVGVVAFVNMLPDFFDHNLPWLQEHLPGVSMTVQEAIGLGSIVLALLLLAAIWSNERPQGSTVARRSTSDPELKLLRQTIDGERAELRRLEAENLRLQGALAHAEATLNFAAPSPYATNILPALSAATQRPSTKKQATVSVEGHADFLDYVSHVCEGQTDAATSSALAPYIGLMAVVTGAVRDVSVLSPGRVMVDLDISYFDKEPGVLLEFSGSQSARARVLQKGASVKARGRIDDIKASLVSVIKCKFV